jgi:hypothetical protein
VFGTDSSSLIPAILVGVAVAGVAGMASVGRRYVTGRHVQTVRTRSTAQERAEAADVFLFGTEENKFTKEPATPGAIETFPKLQRDVSRIFDIVSDLALANHGNGNGHETP